MSNRRQFVLRSLSASAALGAPAVAAFDFDKAIGTAQDLAADAAPLIQTFTMSEADEKQMGNQFYADHLQKSGGAVPDAAAQQALRSFASPLIQTSEREFDWEITLVENDSVNAWALPGGKMAVHSGLIKHAVAPEELASVIAHEIGHAELSHGAQQMKNQTFMQTLSSGGRKALAAWSGTGAALTGEVLGQLEGPVFQMVNAGYSRKREFEADAHILAIFEQRSLDPSKADDFFRTLDTLYPAETDVTTSLFSSHPVTRDRIERIEELAAGRTTSEAADLPGWKALKERYPNA